MHAYVSGPVISWFEVTYQAQRNCARAVPPLEIGARVVVFSAAAIAAVAPAVLLVAQDTLQVRNVGRC